MPQTTFKQRWEKFKPGFKKTCKYIAYGAVPTVLLGGLIASAILCPPALAVSLVGLIIWGAILHYRDKWRQEKNFARVSGNQDPDHSEELNPRRFRHFNSTPPAMIATVTQPLTPTDQVPDPIPQPQSSQPATDNTPGPKLSCKA